MFAALLVAAALPAAARADDALARCRAQAASESPGGTLEILRRIPVSAMETRFIARLHDAQGERAVECVANVRSGRVTITAQDASATLFGGPAIGALAPPAATLSTDTSQVAAPPPSPAAVAPPPLVASPLPAALVSPATSPATTAPAAAVAIDDTARAACLQAAGPALAGGDARWLGASDRPFAIAANTWRIAGRVEVARPAGPLAVQLRCDYQERTGQARIVDWTLLGVATSAPQPAPATPAAIEARAVDVPHARRPAVTRCEDAVAAALGERAAATRIVFDSRAAAVPASAQSEHVDGAGRFALAVDGTAFPPRAFQYGCRFDTQAGVADVTRLDLAGTR